jgi:hypothetical protein
MGFGGPWSRYEKYLNYGINNKRACRLAEKHIDR